MPVAAPPSPSLENPSYLDDSLLSSPDNSVGLTDVAFLSGLKPNNFASHLYDVWRSAPDLSATTSFEDYLTKSLEKNIGHGEDKPMGYIPLESLVSVRPDAIHFISELANRGIRTKIIKHGGRHVHSGALYSYEPTALQAVLDKHRVTLEDSEWPTTADEFVERAASQTVPGGTALFDAVADAFGDYNNPQRLERPVDIISV